MPRTTELRYRRPRKVRGAAVGARGGCAETLGAPWFCGFPRAPAEAPADVRREAAADLG